MSALVLAIPSKGRLQEQVSAFLADCGLALDLPAGGRGYVATIPAAPGVEVRLASASDIARQLRDGEAHLGVTGEDLLRELGAGFERVALVRALGFGRADLVVACPSGWLDVERLSDLAAVAHELRRASGRRLRVATKYLVLTRAFFAARGFDDYRLVESLAATEGAPAAGVADVIVDITTSGATLAANHLRALTDGLILSSQAQLAASRGATWTEAALTAAARLLNAMEARQLGRTHLLLRVPVRADGVAAVRAAASAFGCRPAGLGESGLLALYCPRGQVVAAAAALREVADGPIGVFEPVFTFDQPNPSLDALRAAVGAPTG